MTSINPDTAAAAALPVSTGVSGHPATGAVRSPLRALCLLAGAAGAGMLSVWIWMLGRVDGRFVLMEQEWVYATLPAALVYAAAGALSLGCAGVVWALLRDMRLRGAIAWCIAWARRHPMLGLLVAIVVAVGAIDLYELFVDAEARRYDRSKGIGLRPYMLREDVRSWLLFGATLMIALAISAMKPWCPTCIRRVSWLRASLARASSTKAWLAVAFLCPAVLGSAMSLLALDGVPHFSDSLTYQMQGRMLYAGQMTMPAPKHPDLFTHSLFFVTDGQHFDVTKGHVVYEGERYFGKYPIGWPAVLGAFDRLGIGFMANAILCGLGALVTYGLARQVAPRRVAVLAALLLGLSPWAWFNGAHFASHVASMLAVNGFLLFFLRVVNVKPHAAYGSAIGAGLCLGAALLVRPFDAAMFALPAVVVAFALLLRNPRRWLAHGAIITLATAIGIGIYFWSNAVTTGHATVSPYTLEGRWAADWDTAITSIIHRFLFQWAELNARFPGFGIGGMTVAVLGGIVAAGCGRFHRSTGLWVLIASNALFFVGSTPFLFTNVWWGPRWLLPVTPLVAILGAELVSRVLAHAGRSRERPDLPSPAPAAQLGFMILMAGLCVGLTAGYAGKWYQHRLAPPHNVSAAADKRATQMGLADAVVAMPLDGRGRAPFDARAGMVFMHAPFEANPVIYVRKVENWAAKAKECFPGRQLYELIADKEDVDGFVIRKAVSQ